jgi:O-antigen ligase
MSAVSTETLRPARTPFGVGFLRRHSDLWLAFALGSLVGLLILTLPMQAALSTAVVGAFVLIMLVDTRVALFALLLVRATVDVFATVPILNIEGFTPNALMSLLVIALGAVHIAANRINIRRIPLASPFAIFVAVGFLGLAMSPSKADALEDWLRIVSAFLIFVVVVDLMRTEAERRWLLRVIVLSSVLPLSVGMYQYVTGQGFDDLEEAGIARVLATFVHPSPYAFYLVQIVPLVLLLLAHAQSRLLRLGLAVMLPVMVLSIYATQTRGAWIGLVVMIAVFMWFRAKWTLLFIPMFLLAAYIGMADVRTRVSAATSGSCESVTYCESSVLWRAKQWERTVELPNPVELVTVGAGLHSVFATYGEFTHNEYLRLLVETGLIGLAATLVLYGSLFNLARKGFREAEGNNPFKRDLMLAFLMAFAARALMSGADNLLVITVLEWYFWAFAAVVVVESGAYDRLAHIQDGSRKPKSTGAVPRPALVSEAAPA